MKHFATLSLIFAILYTGPVYAQNVQVKDAAELKSLADIYRKIWKRQTESGAVNVPLFDRIIQFDLPFGFVPVYQAQSATGFIMEFVPDGEKIETWTKLVTVTSNPGVGSFALEDEALAKAIHGTRGSCEGYSHFQILGSRRIDSDLSEVSLSGGCGKTAPQAYEFAKQGGGEQNVMFFFRDKLNIYSVQYAERGKSFTESNLPISNERGKAILSIFGNVLLCAWTAKDQLCKNVLAAEMVRQGNIK
jgi:hypothetical protein